jgi:hypothetical protein
LQYARSYDYQYTARFTGKYGVLAYDQEKRAADFRAPDARKEHALETHGAFVADLMTTMEKDDWD